MFRIQRNAEKINLFSVLCNKVLMKVEGRA